MLSFDGNTASYLQYAYMRIYSIFRRANIDLHKHTAMVFIDQQEEKDLTLKLLQFDKTIEQVAVDCYPYSLCSYLYEVASA